MKEKITDWDRINMQEAWLNISGMIVFLAFCCYWKLVTYPICIVLPIGFILGPMFLINIYTGMYNQKIDEELLAEQEKKEAQLQAEKDKAKTESQIWIN